MGRNFTNASFLCLNYDLQTLFEGLEFGSPPPTVEIGMEDDEELSVGSEQSKEVDDTPANDGFANALLGILHQETKKKVNQMFCLHQACCT